MTNFSDLPIDAAIHRWIARYAEASSSFASLDVSDPAAFRETMRKISDIVSTEFTSPAPDGVSIEDFTIDGPDGQLRLRRYRADSAPTLAPTQLWLHGGGFFAGAVDELLNDRLCESLALASGVQLISLDYRLAPEHPYPAPVHDALAALAAIASDPQAFGVDPQRLGIGGNSAGAAIAASAALHARDARNIDLVHLDAEVIPAALPPIGDSVHEYAQGFGLDGVAALRSIYFGPEGPADQYGSVLDAPSFTGLPPTLLMLAEYDPLRDSGVRFAERLEADGVPVVLIVGEGHLHASLGITAQFAGAREWNRRHAEELALAYATASDSPAVLPIDATLAF